MNHVLTEQLPRNRDSSHTNTCGS